MPTSNADQYIFRILQLLLPKTQGNQAAWINDGDTLTIHLPTVRVSLGANTAEDNKVEYFAVVALPNGKEVAKATVVQGNSLYSGFQMIYAAAQDASWKTLARDIEKLVSEQDIIGTTTTAPPELPAQSTSEQAQLFFEKIAGEWRLDYSHGEEVVNIDTNGNYFMLTLKDGKVISTTARPHFRLEVLSCNDALTSVEIAKVLLNGRTRQIEVLEVAADKMTGYAKHDGHKLIYTRR